MPYDNDHYAAYYSDKLWLLLPALYRAADSDTVDGVGPLRELVNRIGVQAAILRRSIDRTWEDQSIESCDDWLIPYIGDLLATNLVSGLDARGQRLDVAKTIYYRRRKGTVALLEELAADITGWDVRVVEFFRRLGRTRHGLDPEIGFPFATKKSDDQRLQLAEGLIGKHTHTGTGGYADLRNAYGASRAHTAFDEYSHTLDVRQGQGHSGWYNIPKLGVFLWRLRSFEVALTTPVPIKGTTDHYVFDPTGRSIPLFAKATRKSGVGYGEQWVSPEEWQLPTPISNLLYRAERANLYPDSLAVYREPGDVRASVDDVKVYPETGCFHWNPKDGSTGDPLRVTYHYGFSSNIGAGPYDRRQLNVPPLVVPKPESQVSGGGDRFVTALVALADTGTVTLNDSLTYNKLTDLSGIKQITLRAADKMRPVLRPPDTTTEWVLTGKGDTSSLVMDGLLLSGFNIVLRGTFKQVLINCSTFDPGNDGSAQKPPAIYMSAADGRLLRPTHLIIEADIAELVVQRSIIGPILLKAGGAVENTTLIDSIVQGLGTEPALDLLKGATSITRSTLLGKANLHRLYASDSIFADVATIEDVQHGCVRFSAYTSKSLLPHPYESAEIPLHAPLFTSIQFGEPGYAQLSDGADRAILDGPKGRTITTGAEDGSEMGAFCREQNAIKTRSLLIKYDEYMPVGLVPVVINVT